MVRNLYILNIELLIPTLSEPYKAGPLEVILTITATSKMGMLKTKRSEQLKS
jgi:hypothetical protein